MLVKIPSAKQPSAFLLDISPHLIDEKPITLQNSPSYNAPNGNGNTETDQQSVDVPSTSQLERRFHIGSTVRSSIDGVSRVSIVTRVYRIDMGRKQKYKIRHLNESNEIEVAEEALSEINPESGDIPRHIKEVDSKLLTECLTKDQIQALWNGDSDSTVPTAERLTLYWHHRLRHAPLVTLRRLSMRGILPACIKSVLKMPLCAACAFAQAHRRNWRGKGDLPRGIRKESETNPGDGTSCDHLISRQPGLMPQSTGILIHARFWGSVIYVDHFSDYIYSHLIQGTTSSDTLKSKHGYEREAATFGVKIKLYHADNLRFNDNNFMGDCITANQKITFCGVGAHHQNAVVESKIKILTNGARTVLLHAKRKWPKVITTVLWPFALQSVVERHNRLHLDQDGKSPLEKFSQTTKEIVVSDFHTWGCPVFILDAANQSGSIGTTKWDPKSHARIYLGRSPCHAGSVILYSS